MLRPSSVAFSDTFPPGGRLKTLSKVAVRRHQAAEAALNGSSERKAPQGEAYEIG